MRKSSRNLDNALRGVTLLQGVGVDLLTRWFPRLSTFVLAPATLGLTAFVAFSTRDILFSRGSYAGLGLGVALFIWLVLAFGLSTACLLFSKGLERLDQPHPMDDVPPSSVLGIVAVPLLVMVLLGGLGLLAYTKAIGCDVPDAVAYGQSLPRERLARLYDDVQRTVPQGKYSSSWSRKTADLPAFSDLQASVVQGISLNVTQIVLKSCKREPVRLMVYTDPNDNPRIELYWQEGLSPESRLMWQPPARPAAPVAPAETTEPGAHAP